MTEVIFSPRRSVIAAIDLVIIALTFNIFAYLSPHSSVAFGFQSVFFSAVYAVSFVLLGVGLGYYDRSQRFAISNIAVVSIVASVLAFAVSTLATYFWFYSIFGRLILTWGMAGSWLSLLLLRLAARSYMLRHPYGFTSLGNSALLEELKTVAGTTAKKRSLYRYVDLKLADLHASQVVQALVSNRIGVLVVGSDAIQKDDYVELAVHAYRGGVRLVDEVKFYSELFERLPLDAITKRWILTEGITGRRISVEFLKRTMDAILAFAGLVFALPLMATIACAIKLTSPGPVLFVQPRMGRFCQPFSMLKFRTMKVSDHSAEGGFTRGKDDRVTWIGRLIRPLHLDELPQLLNILRGDMSLVGARPEALPFARKMIKELPLYELRYLMRPGLTGHAQLSLGYAMDTTEATRDKLSFDLYYLCSHSLLLDVRVILRTVFLLVRGAR